MNEELKKSLTDLIDETLLELEELKKSRFSASEIDIKGPGEGIAGKPTNGDLHAKAEDKKDDDKDEDEKDEAEKAEGHNRQADPDGGHHKMDKGEMAAGPSDGSSKGSAPGHNRQADPDGGHHKMDKAEDKKDDKKDKKEPHKDDPEHEEKEKVMAKKLLDMHKGEMKKSQEEAETFMKSYVDDKVKPLEDKLTSILDLVNKIADQPVPPKGLTGRAVPLMKSAEDSGEQLSKSEVASKLFDLKKSGTKVDSLDITRAEMGQDLSKIIEKYKIS